jgi:hypothetical protein
LAHAKAPVFLPVLRTLSEVGAPNFERVNWLIANCPRERRPRGLFARPVEKIPFLYFG